MEYPTITTDHQNLGWQALKRSLQFWIHRATERYQESVDRTTPPAAPHRPEGRPEATFGAVWNQSFRWWMVNVGIPNKGLLIRNPMIILIQPAVIYIYNFISVVKITFLNISNNYLQRFFALLSWRPIKIDYVESLSIVTSVIISIVILIIQSTYQLNVPWVNYLQSFTPTSFQISNCPRMS